MAAIESVEIIAENEFDLRFSTTASHRSHGVESSVILFFAWI